jgi:hypothetical protein
MVKSGYYLQWKHIYGASASEQALPGSSAMNPVWKILWKLKIPSNIKKIMWRALHGIMPLKCILINRYIGDNGSCPLCNQSTEDVMPFFFVVHLRRRCGVRLGLKN